MPHKVEVRIWEFAGVLRAYHSDVSFHYNAHVAFGPEGVLPTSVFGLHVHTITHELEINSADFWRGSKRQSLVSGIVRATI